MDTRKNIIILNNVFISVLNEILSYVKFSKIKLKDQYAAVTNMRLSLNSLT